MLAPELFRSALQSAPDAIVICDARGTIIFANTQASALFGYAGEQLVGQPIEQLLPERSHALHRAHRGRFAHNPRTRPMGAGLDLQAQRRDGSEFLVEISLSPITDGPQPLVAAVIRDVSERRRIQAELITERERADRANLAKSRLLATASHDLRQPLQALALLNGVLTRLPTDPAVSEALAGQQRAISAMSRLVNALLDIGKLESGAIRPQLAEFSVASLFEQLRGEFTPLADSKGLELSVDSCTERVRTDPSLLEQLLRNLLSNAIKYTRRGKVLLRCLHGPSIARLQVIDTGIGISPDHLPYIYDEFFQVGDPAAGGRDGYGLGLSIVSRIVALLGLKLEVHSQPGQGSSFCLDVPIATAQA